MSDEEMPFICPACKSGFGPGDGAALGSVVSQMPFSREPTPCCGALITGTWDARAGSLDITEWSAP